MSMARLGRACQLAIAATRRATSPRFAATGTPRKRHGVNPAEYLYAEPPSADNPSVSPCQPPVQRAIRFTVLRRGTQRTAAFCGTREVEWHE